MSDGPTNPRALGVAVQRVMLMRRTRCTFGERRRNVMAETGEMWHSREPCGAPQTYATVRNGRVSPRCETHARIDAEQLGVEVNENVMVEYKADRHPKRAQKPPRPEPANPESGIECLTAAASRLFGSHRND